MTEHEVSEQILKKKKQKKKPFPLEATFPLFLIQCDYKIIIIMILLLSLNKKYYIY